MALEERRAYYCNYLRKPCGGALTEEPARRREAPSLVAFDHRPVSPTICAFCHLQIDDRVYRKGNAKLDRICHPLYARRQPIDRPALPGVCRARQTLLNLSRW